MIRSLGSAPGMVGARKPQLPADDRSKAFAASAAAGLAKKLGVPSGAVKVTDFENVTWSNSALGFSERDMGWADQMMPGYRVGLQSGNDRYEYHAALSGEGRYALMPPTNRFFSYFHEDARGILVPDQDDGPHLS